MTVCDSSSDMLVEVRLDGRSGWRYTFASSRADAEIEGAASGYLEEQERGPGPKELQRGKERKGAKGRRRQQTTTEPTGGIRERKRRGQGEEASKKKPSRCARDFRIGLFSRYTGVLSIKREAVNISVCARCAEEQYRPTSAAASGSICVENNRDQNHGDGTDRVGENANNSAK